MKTFTIAQIKYHFNGEPYVDCPEFIGQLVQHKILVKVSMNQYTYDLSKLNQEIMAEITMIIKHKLLTYNRSKTMKQKTEIFNDVARESTTYRKRSKDIIV